MVDPDVELREGGGGILLLALLDFRPSMIFIPKVVGGRGANTSPRSVTGYETR